MTDAEQQSARGRQLQDKIDEIAAKAGDVQDIIADTQNQIKAFASDSYKFDALKEGFGALRDIGTGLIGVMDMLGVEFGDNNAMLKTMATTYSVFNAAVAVTNALQKDGAIYQGVVRMQRWLSTMATTANTAAETANTTAVGANTAGKVVNTAATAANTIATKAATVAMSAFNAVCAMNPYVLIAMAAAGAAVAIYSFASASAEATEKEKEANKEAEKAAKLREEQAQKLKQIEENYYNSVGQKAAELKMKYDKLRDAWLKLKTAKEKGQFIKDRKKDFDDFGASIDDIKKAELFFVGLTDKVVQAFLLRARAAALAARQEEKLKEYYARLEAHETKFHN